jgi:hypothetical protein
MAAEQLSTEAFSGVTITADEPGFRMESVTLPAKGETLPAAAANYESELLTKRLGHASFSSVPRISAPPACLDILGRQ